MKFRQIFSLVSVIVFLVLGCWIIFYPSIYSKRKSLNGEVVIVWKTAPPRSRWIVEVREFGKIRKINYPFLNDVVTIHEGDSLRKEKGSEEFLLKRKNTENWVLLEQEGTVEN